MAAWLCAVLLRVAPAQASDLDLRVGAKGVLDLSGQSDADAPAAAGAPWSHSRLGAGGGGGLYGELHLRKWLGAEVDLLFESNRLFFRGAASSVGFDQRASFEQLRIPLLAKVFAQPSQSVELSAGLGPLLIVGLGGRAKTTVTDNQTTLSTSSVQRSLDYFYQADAALGTALAAELGISFYTLRFQIPVSLRFSYNLLGATAYADRVTQDAALRTSTLAAIETYQLALVVGFGFLIPPREPPPAPVQQGPRPDDPFSPF